MEGELHENARIRFHHCDITRDDGFTISSNMHCIGRVARREDSELTKHAAAAIDGSWDRHDCKTGFVISAS
jgi:hypothetical protein